MFDFFNFGIIYLICNLVGGTLRWIYGSIWRTIFKKPKFEYKEYLFGVKNSTNHYDIHGHHFNNTIITIIFVFSVIGILNNL